MEQRLGDTLQPALAVQDPSSGAVGNLVRPAPPRAMQERLERLLLDDQELLISLHCQLEQIRREIRLLNDDRIVRALLDEDSSYRH